MFKPKIQVIIVSYNTKLLLEDCLRSVFQNWVAHSDFIIQVTVVDNASCDGSAEMVKALFSEVKIIALSENLGFAGANNLALGSHSADYHFLLNSDTLVPQDNHLDEMVYYLHSYPDVGVITPRVSLSDGSLDPACHRGEPTPWASFCYFVGLEKLLPKVKLFAGYHLLYENLRRTHQVQAVSGAAMLVSQAAIAKVGQLDERFFMYAEDLDWCKRIREAGFQVIFFPQAKVTHLKYQSGLGDQKNKVVASKTHAHFYDTMLQYYDKHYKDRYPQVLRYLIAWIVNHKKGVL